MINRAEKLVPTMTAFVSAFWNAEKGAWEVEVQQVSADYNVKQKPITLTSQFDNS